ncbi:MAG: TPM domain-containing protein [Saprospiraceae bacterium]|nr:TPM domain-containing protein [Saprospiraceae bacterium]
MQKKYWVIYINLFVCLVSCTFTTTAQLFPQPEVEEDHYMVDYTKTLKRLELVTLNEQLKKYQEEHGLHLVTVLSEVIEGYSNERLAFEIYQKWKIGGANEDRGILLLGLIRDSSIVFTYYAGGEARKRIANYKLENTIQETMIPILSQQDTSNYYLAIHAGVTKIMNLYNGFSGDLNNQTKVTQQGKFLTVWDKLISLDASKAIETELNQIYEKQGVRIIIDLCKRGKDDVGTGPAQDRRDKIYEYFAQAYGEEQAQNSIIVLIEQYQSILDDALIRNHIHVFQASANEEELSIMQNRIQELQLNYRSTQEYVGLIEQVIREILQSKVILKAKVKQEQLISWLIIGGICVVILLLLSRYIYIRRRRQFAFYEQMMQDTAWETFVEDFTLGSIELQRKAIKKLFDQHSGKRREIVLQDYFEILRADPSSKMSYKPVYQFKKLQKRLQDNQHNFLDQHYIFLLNILRKEIQFFAQKEDLEKPSDLERYHQKNHFFQQCLGYNDTFRGTYYRIYQQTRAIIQELDPNHYLGAKFAQSTVLSNLEYLQKLKKEAISAYSTGLRKEGQIEFVYNHMVSCYPMIERFALHRSFSVEQIMMKEAVYANLGVQLDQSSDLQVLLNEVYKSREYFSLVSGVALSKADADYYQRTLEQYLHILQEPIENLYLNPSFYQQALEGYLQQPDLFWEAYAQDYDPQTIEELKVIYQERGQQIIDADYPIQDLVDFYFYDLKHN